MSRNSHQQDDQNVNSYPYDLGTFHRPVSGAGRDAQTWFDRGLVWCYGFNHEEAVNCFANAIANSTRSSGGGSECVMACWGFAYALGPNYNKPWESFGLEESQLAAAKAHRAVVAAKSHLTEATPAVERGLVDALQYRYPHEKAPSKKECSAWNHDYADAMAKVSHAFPNDLDVATLYADAMMNLTPWQLWNMKTGRPGRRARTLEIKRVLDHALSLEGGDQHPGLLHLYIHLMEMSKTPEAAMPAANLLRGLVPDAGHLNHMPSHLDIMLGDYTSAVIANSAAIIADEKFLAREGPMNFYTLYRCHDYHFRLYSAMFSGQSKIALDTVTRLESTITDKLLRIENPPMADWLESFLAMRVHALVRFGRWKDLVALKVPQDQELYCVTTSLTHYAKGVALAALGRVEAAEEQRTLFRESIPRVKPSRTLFNNKCVDILGVAEAMLDGELEYRLGNFDAAFSHLRKSVAKYDSLPFDEPWGWMQPTRHALGALLLEQGRIEEALATYSADLGIDETLSRQQMHPNNVWALHGYHECLVKLGKEEEAKAIEPALKRALAVADIPIKASCFCRISASPNI